ncbi:helix-turn-helix transcriptional regulator [Zhongshania aquimaris]|uniref:Helix-turn-helix transcriptional regulator n=1 Tax=Zhongshania aquimaris TaxID=2857107 RepID=A0ABS6VV48_9GAMM|nr:helix-turn-helix transcriptional regulator [Zhongshania aquimaris]MBW2942192.1 helix-turn-helix transcriptional regulator [Zhongshania aquimaris]
MGDLSISLAEYDNLVHLVYAGIREEMPWNTFLCELARLTKSRDSSLVFNIYKPEQNYYLLTSDTGLYDRKSQSTIRHLLSMSEMLDTFHSEPLTLAETYDLDQFFSSELYLTHLKPIDIRYILSQDMSWDDSVRVKLSAERTSCESEYTQEDKNLFSLLTPHLMKAIDFRKDLLVSNQMSDLSGSVLSKVSVGSILLDGDGKIISMNQLAKKILASNRGLLSANERLKANNPAKNSELKKAISQAVVASESMEAKQSGIAFKIEDITCGSILDLVIKPITRDSYVGSSSNQAVAVYLHDSKNDHVALNTDTLRTIYGMTPSEAQISALIVEGKTQTEISDILGVSINTVKTHVRGIYDKLGVRNQAHVVAILNRCSARIF